MSNKRILRLVKELAAERMDGNLCPVCKEHPLQKVICPYRLAILWDEVQRMNQSAARKRKKQKSLN